MKKRNKVFVTHTFSDKAWDYPTFLRFQCEQLYVITNGLIKVCKTIKESILMPNAGPSS